MTPRARYVSPPVLQPATRSPTTPQVLRAWDPAPGGTPDDTARGAVPATGPSALLTPLGPAPRCAQDLVPPLRPPGPDRAQRLARDLAPVPEAAGFHDPDHVAALPDGPQEVPGPVPETVWLAPRGYGPVGHALRQALGTVRWGGEGRLQALLAQAAAPAATPLPLPGREPAPGRPQCPPETLRALFEVYRARVPAPEGPDLARLQADGERALGALKVLVERGLNARALERLIARGRHYDLIRSALAAFMTFCSSFLPAGLATLGGRAYADSLDADTRAPSSEASAAALWQQGIPWAAWMVGNLTIGMGTEGAAALLRAAGWDSAYNRPLARPLDGAGVAQAPVPVHERPAGACVQASTAVPFAVAYVGHTVAAGALGPAPSRLALGAGAAATAGLWRALGQRAAADHLEPVWLDGSTEARQRAMHEAIERLESVHVALPRAGWDLAEAMVQTLGTPSGPAVARIGVRTVVAALARGGQALALATGRSADWRLQAAGDAWLGASWGWLSTLPGRLTAVRRPSNGQPPRDRAH